MNNRQDARPRARTWSGKRTQKARVTPLDRPLDVRIFLAAIGAGKSLDEACDLSGLSERRIARWIAFNDFGPTVKKAQHSGRVARREGLGGVPLENLLELNAALTARTWQRAADKWADGDLVRLHHMRMTGELREVWDREAIVSLRRFGKNELASQYERAIHQTPRRPILDPVDEHHRGQHDE